MASHIGDFSRATPLAALLNPRHHHLLLTSVVDLPGVLKSRRATQGSRIRASNGGESYLDMWKKAVERERKSIEFQKLVDNSAGTSATEEEEESPQALARKSSEFQKLLEVSTEERDRIQRMQVIDRAAAAIAAARAFLKESSSQPSVGTVDLGYSVTNTSAVEKNGDMGDQQRGLDGGSYIISESKGIENLTPGPNFWSWIPPQDINEDDANLMLAKQVSPHPTKTSPLMEKRQSIDFLPIPLESRLLESKHNPTLPPFQSLIEAEKVVVSASTQQTPSKEERELGILFLANAEEAAHALTDANEEASEGFSPDGSRWWKETGIEQRPDGVVCKWTLTRGVSADKTVEWEDKYWEAADQFGYKELGSEKSGRDAAGNVWHEFWRESMWQDHGLLHIEKTADKWGRNGQGEEWQEKWWEHYDASGQAEKWAHKWCSINPSTQLEAGHAHVWHERWGEKYNGKGSSMKYTDKWAERCEGDAWTKWGDKWDEHFDTNGHGVKQGETWWEGKHGECWNRTWGEGHNGSGWVHKYGKSSSGEHWDTHVQQETWYERFPHYGFQHCFDNTVQLREVKRPSDWS